MGLITTRKAAVFEDAEQVVYRYHCGECDVIFRSSAARQEATCPECSAEVVLTEPVEEK